MTIKDLKPGESAVITQVGGTGALRQHFLDMGVIPGAEITLIKLAPLGDPMELRIHGYELTLRLDDAEKIDIESVLRGVGVEEVRRIDPLQLDGAIETVKEVANMPGVKAIIFESPCAMLFKPERACSIDGGKCIDCRKCIKEIGCPGLVVREGKVAVDDSLCNGCGLCSQICPVEAITKGGN